MHGAGPGPAPPLRRTKKINIDTRRKVFFAGQLVTRGVTLTVHRPVPNLEWMLRSCYLVDVGRELRANGAFVPPDLDASSGDRNSAAR
ncbi:MAG: hypothetical protein QOI36_4016 [Pseudonocardiales bacterium]|jgi:hypothetical protein|nr:hypothetical protein [Pseudonocardia sp.]MDT7652610.1 hypothetical protein [Pseudonocardiales bacterium]